MVVDLEEMEQVMRQQAGKRCGVVAVMDDVDPLPRPQPHSSACKGTTTEIRSESSKRRSDPIPIPLTSIYHSTLVKGVWWWAGKFADQVGSRDDAEQIGWLTVVEEERKVEAGAKGAFKPGERNFTSHLIDPKTGRIQYALRHAHTKGKEMRKHEQTGMEEHILSAGPR